MGIEEELSKYLAQIDQYKEQLGQVEAQFAYLQSIINDYAKAKITLERLSKEEEGVELLLPIGGNNFIAAVAKNTSKVLFDIGAGVITEKSSDEAAKKIDKRIKNIQQTKERLTSMAQQLQAELTETTSKAQKLYSEQE
jgi:prefoldin alpha subunit